MPRALVSPLPAPDPGLSCHPAMLSSRGPRVAQAGGTSESQCPGHPNACGGTFGGGGRGRTALPCEKLGLADPLLLLGGARCPGHYGNPPAPESPPHPLATMQVCPPRFCAVAPHKPLDSVKSRLPMGPTHWPLVRGQVPQGYTVIPRRVVTGGAARPKRPHPAGLVRLPPRHCSQAFLAHCPRPGSSSRHGSTVASILPQPPPHCSFENGGDAAAVHPQSGGARRVLYQGPGSEYSLSEPDPGLAH